jgi:DMSO/TMAO reductase YedYZ molybdopterin-dependent catalytic subunit
VRSLRRTDRNVALAGLLAGATALLTLLVGRLLTGRSGFLEVAADAGTHLPLELFDALLGALGTWARGLLFATVCAAVLLAGVTVALASGVGRGRRNPLLEVVGIAALVLFIAELIVLPIFGQGFFGGARTTDPAALHLPIVAASLLYAVVLVGLTSPVLAAGPVVRDAEQPVAGMPRRSFLVRTLATVGAGSLLASVLTVAVQVVAAGTRRGPRPSGPSAPGDFGPTPAQTPVAEFYQVNKDFLPTNVDAAAWRFQVDGLVDRPQAYTLDEIRALPAQEADRTLECISFDVVKGDDLIGNQRWRGVRISDLLDSAGVQPTASWVLWEAEDGFTESLPLAVARDPDTWLAYEMGGAPLTTEHGYPARILIAGRFGMKQPKWVRRLQLADHDADGYWEQRGWDREAVVRTMSRIDAPSPGESVPVGRPFTCAGIANSGDRGIKRVELSPDGGASWLEAELEDISQPPLGPLTWVRWRVEVTIGGAGSRRLVVRATDGEGGLQEERETPPLPSGSTGWHAVQVVAVEDAASAGASV